MNFRGKQHSGDSLFSILLLLIFCLFTLLLAGTGAAVYKSSAAHLNENYTSRTAIAYVSEKVRQHNCAGDVFFGDAEGNEALVLREEIADEVFLTYIYYYDGALCELFVREQTDPTAAAGTRIVELESLEISMLSPADLDQTLNSDKVSETDETLKTDLSKSALLSVTAVSPEGNSLSVLVPYCGDSSVSFS